MTMSPLLSHARVAAYSGSAAAVTKIQLAAPSDTRSQWGRAVPACQQSRVRMESCPFGLPNIKFQALSCPDNLARDTERFKHAGIAEYPDRKTEEGHGEKGALCSEDQWTL